MKLFKIFHFHDLSVCIGIVKTSNEIILIVASDNYDNFRHLWFMFFDKSLGFNIERVVLCRNVTLGVKVSM